MILDRLRDENRRRDGGAELGSGGKWKEEGGHCDTGGVVMEVIRPSLCRVSSLD